MNFQHGDKLYDHNFCNISANTKLTAFNCGSNPGNADGKFVVTVWSGFTAPSDFTAAGKTWTKYGETITLEYKEK